MASYAYFDGTEWVENVDAKGIKNLAKVGVIRPETLIRLPGGKEVSALKISGIDFSNADNTDVDGPEETTQPESQPSAAINPLTMLPFKSPKKQQPKDISDSDKKTKRRIHRLPHRYETIILIAKIFFVAIAVIGIFRGLKRLIRS